MNIYYEMKTESDDNNKKFFDLDVLLDYAIKNNMKDFAVWRIKNGVSDLLEIFENGIELGCGEGIY